MTTDQWHPAKRAGDDQRRPTRVKEIGLRLITLHDGNVVELFSRTREHFSSLATWSFYDGHMSESELQDVVTTLTMTLIHDLEITQGVRLVPLAE
jgi:hypothetical protein